MGYPLPRIRVFSLKAGKDIDRIRTQTILAITPEIDALLFPQNSGSAYYKTSENWFDELNGMVCTQASVEASELQTSTW
jgi:hypothetical protein